MTSLQNNSATVCLTCHLCHILSQSNLFAPSSERERGKTRLKWILVFLSLHRRTLFFSAVWFRAVVYIYSTCCNQNTGDTAPYMYVQKERPHSNSRCVWLNMSMLINILCALFAVCLHFLLGGTASSVPFCCFNQLGNRCATQKRSSISLSHLEQNVESVSGNQHFPPSVSFCHV